MMKILYFSLLVGLFHISLVSVAQQKPEVYISAFFNDAEGAYSLIHDDFGGSWCSGIETYADTMAFSRGLPFSFALIAGHCDDEDWKKAAEMVGRGHQVLNHSMNHKCGKKTGDCGPNTGNWNEANFKLEIDSSESMIVKQTGKHPAFFMFPFDVHTDTMISYLRHRGYAGARAGQNEIVSGNTDPFYLNYRGFFPEQTAEDLNGFADEAVSGNGWAIREVHGVEDGSWGSIPLEDYKIHLNYLKKQADENRLWVATLSDVLLYKIQQQTYTTAVTFNKSGYPIKIKFRKKLTGNSYYTPGIVKTVKNSAKSSDVTIVLKGISSEIKELSQNGKKLTWTKREGKILINADPEKGELLLGY